MLPPQNMNWLPVLVMILTCGVACKGETMEAPNPSAAQQPADVVDPPPAPEAAEEAPSADAEAKMGVARRKAEDKGPQTKESELQKGYEAFYYERFEEAQNLFRMACKMGARLGCDEAASAAIHRRDVESKPLALADLIRAGGCTSERGTACVWMAGIMQSSWMLKPDPVSAQNYYQVACDAHEPLACGLLAEMLQATDPERAENLRREAVRRSRTKPQLSRFERDRNRFMEEACTKRDHMISCLRRAKFLADSPPPWANQSAAADLYRKICGRDMAEACVELGELLRMGKIKHDFEAAAVAYEKGCSLGNGLSCLQLARMYKAKDVEPPNIDRVGELTRMAEAHHRSADKRAGRKPRSQTLAAAFEELEKASKSWKPPELYCVSRRWEYPSSNESERSLAEVKNYRVVWGKVCREKEGAEVCRESFDPKYVGPMYGLIERCEREILSLRPDAYEHQVTLDAQGVLQTCKATQWKCDGDCVVDLGIEKVSEGPCPR